MKDPVLTALQRELRQVRKGADLPTAQRLADQFELVEALGLGNVERAWEVLERLRADLGTDPETDIGAYFYLSGWEIGRDNLTQREKQYAGQFNCDERTGLRRSDRGITKLATLIRDRAETSRPWAVVSLFQSGASAQVVLHFDLAFESWRPPTLLINNEPVDDLTFVLHESTEDAGRYWSRIVLPLVDLDLDVGFRDVMLRVQVNWPMPVWPTWQVQAWTADPRVLSRLRTFRQRAVEVTLEWWRQERPTIGLPLLTDRGVWTEREARHSVTAAALVLGPQPSATN